MNYYQHEKKVAEFLEEAEGKDKDRYDSVSVKARPKKKMTEIGQPCRHCETPVKRSEHKTPPKYKAGSYWFEWWLTCPKCRAMYMQENAKRWFDGAPPPMVASAFINRVKNREIVERNIAAMFGRQRGPGDNPNEVPW